MTAAVAVNGCQKLSDWFDQNRKMGVKDESFGSRKMNCQATDSRAAPFAQPAGRLV
jgi:hypothetical protein